MSKVSLLIDGNNALWRTFHIFSGVVGASYGFLRQLRYYLDALEADECFICWDGRKASHSRKELYPEYKAGRDKNPLDYQLFYAQWPFIRKLLTLTGVTQIEEEDLEADDVIASLVHYSKKKRKAGRQFVIISSDKDLLCQVRPGVFIFQPVKDNLIGVENFREEFGLSPRQYFEFRLLSGDSSDNIKGITGEKGALWVIQTFGSIEAFYETIQAFQADPDCPLPGVVNRSEGLEIRRRLNWKKFQAMTDEACFEVLERNVDLMSPKIRKPKLEQGKLKEDSLQRLFLKAGFQSLLNGFKGWISPFRRLEK